jgi:hypothetical protein
VSHERHPESLHDGKGSRIRVVCTGNDLFNVAAGERELHHRPTHAGG